MKMSRRAKRMNRHHARSKRAGLNMVSLMDIFTLLVFFLLVSSSSVQEMPNAKTIKLPESVADKMPKETVVIMVSGEDIIIQGQKVASVADVMRPGVGIIEPLREALLSQAKRRLISVPARSDGKPVARDVTIMGDRLIPYKLLKKIMLTCTSVRYSNISLAVLRKLDKKGT